MMVFNMRALFLLLFVLNIFFISDPAFSENKTVNLVVAYKTVYFAGKKVKAIAVNNQIPAPTLHFKEGDQVVINVFNHLNVGTIIHWHGIILPWQMDGVEGISQPVIAPQKMFRYHFTLRQSGTYWYHAHAGFQEQQGLYGAIVIDPPKHFYHPQKDFTVILSDWSNTSPEKIFLNLKKDGDYYSPRFPLQPSLVKFMHDYHRADAMQRKQLRDDYKMMQEMRMSIYDLSDVAYDAFLLNGKTNKNPWTARVKIGDVVRLRLIDAGGSTNFHVKIPGYILKIIQMDGNNIRPIDAKDFLITPGETYDVLVKITHQNPAIIYAESADTRGHAIGALITKQNQPVNYKSISPFPEPIPVTQEMMNNMMSHDMMDMPMKMSMQNEPSIVGDHMAPYTKAIATIKTTGTQYQHVASLVKTNNPHKKISGVIKMELFGYMGRYIWMINGLPEYKTKPIIFESGKRYRIIFTNESMMHHPMHIHGHWFILRNGHGSHDPLLHTIDVAPGSTVVADIDADASGQWFFHCHHLYHMMAGMARVFQYQTIINIVHGKQKPTKYIAYTKFHNRPIVRDDQETPIIPALILHPMGHASRFYFTNFLEGGFDPWHNTQEISFKGLYGGDYNKLKLNTENAEIEKGKITDFNVDIFYYRVLNQFWALESGVNYFNEPAYRSYWSPGIGIDGTMPYFIDTELRAYFYHDSVKFDVELSRDTQITNNFFIRLGVESILATANVNSAPISSGLNTMQYIVRPYYRVAPGIDIYAQYQHTKDYQLLANLDHERGDADNENIYVLGIALVF